MSNDALRERLAKIIGEHFYLLVEGSITAGEFAGTCDKAAEATLAALRSHPTGDSGDALRALEQKWREGAAEWRRLHGERKVPVDRVMLMCADDLAALLAASRVEASGADTVQDADGSAQLHGSPVPDRPARRVTGGQRRLWVLRVCVPGVLSRNGGFMTDAERLREALERYEADPVNAFDRPASWQKLHDLLDAARVASTPRDTPVVCANCGLGEEQGHKDDCPDSVMTPRDTSLPFDLRTGADNLLRRWTKWARTNWRPDAVLEGLAQDSETFRRALLATPRDTVQQDERLRALAQQVAFAGRRVMNGRGSEEEEREAIEALLAHVRSRPPQQPDGWIIEAYADEGVWALVGVEATRVAAETWAGSTRDSIRIRPFVYINAPDPEGA